VWEALVCLMTCLCMCAAAHRTDVRIVRMCTDAYLFNDAGATYRLNMCNSVVPRAVEAWPRSRLKRQQLARRRFEDDTNEKSDEPTMKGCASTRHNTIMD
jgi:hypothetical protein